MMTDTCVHPRRIRSFVRRDGRMTAGQLRAVRESGPRFGLDAAAGMVNFPQVFGRVAPCFLEIGFGTGHSLLEAAVKHPEMDFIGVETHLPGVGALFAGIESAGITNVRVMHEDVVKVLAECIPDGSLAGIQIFFPDPWPKRRHHKRRLIQPSFVAACAAKLSAGGTLHLATDWEDYAVHMMRVLSDSPLLKNMAGLNQYAGRAERRPLITRFERRASLAGHVVRELAFVKG